MSKTMMSAKKTAIFLSPIPLQTYFLLCRQKQILEFVDDYSHHRRPKSTADKMLSFTSSYSMNPAQKRVKPGKETAS